MPKAKKPVSDKQLAANRANAARSTGPRTPEGKSRTAQNARKHGFAAADFAVVRLEEGDAVAHLRADLIHTYRPVNSQELFAIERIALAQQGLLRIARLEAGLLTSSINQALDPVTGRPFIPMSRDLTADIEVTRAQNRNYALAEGFHKLVRQADSWKLFLRYQAQAERMYRRAIEEFERLKTLRGELPNEPISDAQPQANETASTPSETNPIPAPATPAPGPAPAAPPETACPRNGLDSPRPGGIQ